MSRAVLSIGSNLGDRLGHLRSVVSAAGDLVVAVSGVYETAPWGPVEQDDFLNAVLIAADPDRHADGWLAFAQSCERRAGRVRSQRWGPRRLDVDVIDVDGLVRDDPRLTLPQVDPDGPGSADQGLILPHPRAAERAFVLVPWLDADPAARLAGVPVADLLAALPATDRAGVRRRHDLRLAAPYPQSPPTPKPPVQAPSAQESPVHEPPVRESPVRRPRP